MGKGLQRAFAAARKTQRKKPKQPVVTDSCGCVLCDLAVPKELQDGQWVHMMNRGHTPVRCPRGDAPPPALSSQKGGEWLQRPAGEKGFTD